MSLEAAEEAKGDSNPDLNGDTPEDVESDGNTTFLRAARDGNLQEILEYLKGSTDINTSNPNGLNALHLASKEGHLNIVTELLRRGANVEAATKKGNTALHIASLAGHADIVKLLVENGAKVNVQAQMGFTPLYMASQESHAEVVKYLLANGASQTLATADGFTPLAVALQQGHEKVVTVLLEHDTKGKLRLPALHIAAKKDDTKSAALLLQNEQNALNNTTDSGFTPLHIASHYGNDNVGSLLIQKGADVNYRAKNNITPLHVASRWGKKNMVTLLLDNRAVIDERTRDGLTPLHCASRSGHDKVVDCLLERGAPYSAKTKNGLTPIHMAAQGDHVDCVRLLLLHKAPVDDVTVDYLTPLHVAAHCGNVKTAKLLLDRKCEPNARALNGFTPLHIACKKNRIKVVELLLKYGASIEATTESGLTPLHVASFMGHMNIVIYLIQHNANPDFPTVRGETALHLAARANQTDIIRILLRNGASVDARAREQQTPLHIAARLGNVDNVTLLLHHGASPDAVTKDLYTPLHIAAKEGHEEVASVLLDNGASHGLTTKKGFTPLHIAAKYGNIKVARLLLQKDANPDVQGKNGLTPLHVATHYNHVNVALLLLDHKASPHCVAKNGYTPLHIAAKKNQMDIATTLLEFGAKPDAESKNGFTPLHLAAQEGHTDMVSLLLEHKANVNSKAHNGLTPMHLAAQEDKVNIAEVLVKYGAEIDPQTKAGYTPLHTACHFGQSNMVRYLLDQGASVSSTTKLGYTPLHQAAQQGHVQVVNLLLKNKASPNAVTNNGQTALSIAQRLGYISVVDTLSAVTEVTETPSEAELKYKVVSPETMQETLLSDSEDEGGEDSISLERGESTSPLETSYNEKDFMRRHPESEDARKRMKSEMSTALRYPSYLEHGPDYEAEMQYFSGDTLSPHGRDKSTRGGDSVFGGDYSTLDRLDRVSTSSSQAENKIRTTDESHSELEYGDDQDYMEAQHITQSFASYSSSAPDRAATVPPGKSEGGAHFSSYSGSSFNANFDPDNVAIDRTPVYSGKLKWKSFLISFMVDARGGAMRGRRHSGVRIIIPPRKASMPTRVTCRLIKKEKLMHPLPLNEGEALAARILEMGPVGTKFLGQIVIEIPHFASLRGKERAIKILRSDNGEKWEEHPIITTDEAVNKALNASLEDLDQDDELTGKRVTRILTDDFPRYFAIVTKIREETNYVGEEGGVISSTVVPQVQAVFPEGALTKKIKVGLQAQPVSPELVAKLLGNRIAVSPIVTLEPRRRKFHKSITLTIPYPRAAQKGMINQYEREAPTLRVLYSISEGTSNTEWDDLTDQAQPEFVDDCVSFTTRVSGRYWLMDCQDVSKAIPMATELYRETITVPYMARFVVFAKRTGEEEGKLRMFCMTDDKIDKTLEKQEHFVEVARSRDVEVLEGRPQFVEMAGNLIPVTKSGDQLYINFKAFRENRLPCTVRIRDMDQDPAARVAFMKEPKVARGEVPQTPMCNLNISLPDMSTSSSMEMDGDAALELRKRSAVRTVVTDNISQAQLKLTDVADTLKGDWVMLAQQLDVSSEDQNDIKNKYKTVNDQALAMLQLWVDTNKEEATGNALETALRRINREDVVKKCMYNVETVEDEVEAAAARVAMDQSGFDNFTEEVGISQEVPMKRGVSLDVEYDEQDIVKESESAAEESQPSSEGGSMVDKQAPQAMEEDAEPSYLADDHEFVAEVNTRRPVAKTETKPEKTEDDFFDLINQLDKYSEIKEAQEKRDRPEEVDDKASINEDEILHTKQDRGKVDDVIAKVEQFDQKSAPPPKQEIEKDTLDTEEGVRTPPPSPVDRSQSEEEKRQEICKEVIEKTEQVLEQAEQEEEDELVEEEIEESITQIEEIYQESTDGKTWRTVRKVTTITPQGTSERFEILKEEKMAAVTELAARLSKEEQEDEEQQEEGLKDDAYETVFDSKVPANETVYEETLEDGTVVKHRKIRRPSEHIHFQMDDDENNMDIIREEGPPEDEVDIEDWEEVLPDGTVHTTHKVRRHSVKHIRRSLKSENGEEEEIFEGDVVIPGTQREDIIETFEEPPRSVTEIEDVDAELDDGTKIKRHVVMNRMIHKIKTRQVSIDAQGHEEEEDYEIDEIIPGTESAFIEGSSSSSSSSSFLDSDVDDVMEADLGEVEEVLDDGTVIKKRVIESTETKKVRSRAGSIDETITRNITEERISPSPRSRSPVHFTETGSIDVDENLEVVRKTLRTAHLEAEQRGNVVESSFSMTEDKVTSGPAIKSGLMGQIDDANQRAATEVKELGETGFVKRSIKKVTYEPGGKKTITDVAVEFDQDKKRKQEMKADQRDLSQTAEQRGLEQQSLQDESTSSSAALLQNNVDTSADNNTYSQVSMENNDSVITDDQTVVSDLPPPLPLQMEKLTKEDGKRVISSYENVYEGVELDPQINRLSLDASELDIGDRFDTKQKEVHLQTTELASSYEQLYENGQSGKDVALIPEDKSKIQDEDKLSSSSSEVAQVEEVDTKPDSYEVQDHTEEKTEETDVEEQFSPLPKHSPKPNLDLQLEPHKTSFSFTETPPESLSPSQHDNEISPLQETLGVQDMAAISVGVSPSDLLPRIMERSDESKESDMEKSYEEAKLSESTDHITLDSTTYEQTEEIIEQSFQSEDFEIKEAKQEDMDESFEEKDDEMDKSGTISEATSEYKPTMAFENLGFSDEDNIRENQVIAKGQESPEKSYLSKQISSEDLEERPTQFDFDAELREEIEQQQIAIQEMEKRQAEFQFSHYLITSKHDIIDQTVLENKEDDKHQEDLKRSDDFVGNLQEEEVQEGELDMVESDTQEEDEDILEGRSSESSSDNGEVFDEISGRFVPWEIQHQFRRQFSDSYINQEKKTSLQSARSIDLGTFYRRDHDDQTQYDSVTFMKETDASDSAETSPNKPVQRKQVRFSFNDSDVELRAESPQELEEETLRFEQYYIKESPDKIVRFVDSGTETDLSVDDYRQQYVDASKTEKLSPSEPHNLISETHEQAVIDNILKSRMAVRVEHRDAATTTSEEELTIQRSSVSSFSSEATTSSFVTTGSFAELSTERTSAEKHIVTDHLSGEELFAREDVTTDTSLTPVKETSSTLDSEVISVVSRESRLAQQELLQESSDERDRSLSPSNESEELSTTYEGQETEVHEQKSESKFTIAFPSFGKSLADNEIYESSETGDTTEEKLSPIEETPQDDFPEEQEEIKPEKKVTFQTEHDVQHLQSASSEDLVKTSTSSSEMSMEPTLLAASYDLDSGHVSHVVTAYDMSPDSVEKQFPVPATTKAILSSPEDDVFEADACTFEDDKGFLMVSDTGKKIMSREKKLSSSGESCPSPPAPTPKDSSAVAHETMPDLEGAAIKLQDELIDSNEDLTPECENSQDLEITLRDSKLETKQETTEEDKTEHSPCDDTDSPFEILSPVDAEEFEKYMEDSGKSQQMATSFESVTTTTSSFSEIQSSDIMTMSDQKSEMMMSFEVAPLEPSAPPMPDIKSESSFEQSSPISSEPSEKGLGSPLDVPEHSDSGILLPDLVQGSAVCGDQQTQSLKGQKVSLPNGPTEVEYNPEIDIDYSEDYTPAHMTESEQPDIIQSTSPTMPTGQTTVFDIEATETQQEKQIDSEEKQEIRTTEEVQREAALYESTSYVTHEVIEELRVQPGFDPLASSDQTLYGLDMPSEETGGMSISMSQMESSGRFDTEPESDSINVSGGLVSQLDEDTSEKDLVMTETDKEVDSGLPHSQLEASSDALDEKDDEMAYTTTENLEIEQEIAAPPEETISYDIKSYTVYPGKRALELDETQEEILQREAEMEILTGVEALTPDSDTQDIRDLQDIQATQEDRENLEYQEQEIDGCQMYVEQIYEEADDTYDDNDDEGYMRGGEEMVGVDEFKQQTLTVEEDEFAGKSDDELLELVEDKEDNSQVKVLVTKPSRGDELVQEGQSEYEEGDDNQEKFDLEVDVYDLERPVTPTPVDAKQQFFSEDEIYQDTEKDICEDEGVQTEDGEMIGEIPEQKTIYVSGKLVNTASEFVENVLSEARQRVTMETTEEKECITEVETSKTDVVLEYVKERMEEQEEEEQEIEEEEGKETSEQLSKQVEESERDSVTSLSDQSLITSAPLRPTSSVLGKQVSEEIPEIMITQHLHKQRDEGDYPIYYVQDAKSPTSSNAKKGIDVESEIVEDEFIATEGVYTEYVDRSTCIPEEEDEEEESDTKKPVEEFMKEQSASTQSTAVFSGKDFIDFSDSCVPEEEEEEEESKEVLLKSSTRPLTMMIPVKDQDELDSTTTSTDKDKSETRIEKDTDSFLVKTDSETAPVIPGKEDDQTPEGDTSLSETIAKKQVGEIEAASESGVRTETFIEYERSESVEMKSEHDMHSQEDTGDSSSVDSFTTVVPANEEDQQDDEDRLEDFASMTSSFNSDVHGKVVDEEREKDLEGLLIEWDHKESVDDKWQSKKTDDTLVDWDFKEMTRTMETDSEPPLIEWAESESIEEMKSKHDAPLIDWTQRDINGQSKEKHKDDVRKDDLRGIEEEKEDEDYNGGPLIDWGPREEEGSESSLESDRYEYIDKTALSVITEISDEDRFEMIDKDDLESEIMSDIMSDRPHSSPDYPPAPSPGINSYKFFNKNSDKDDISVTSSLLEFERLENEIAQSGSVGSLESADKDSLGGSMDERIFKYNKSTDRDDISITSSLAEFERLEREVVQSSSSGSVEKITPPDSRGSGSMSSLAEFEKLEKEMVTESQERRSSSESFKKSETSSHSSLSEFERLENEIAMAEELEAEAQKIVSILESGKLIQEKHEFSESKFMETKSYKHEIKTTVSKSYDDIDRDSIDGKDDQDLEDSLSEDKKTSKEENLDQAEVDSLEGDVSELTSMTSSVILAADMTGSMKEKDECDADSLHDEAVMKTSGDSLGDESLMKISGDSLGEEFGLKTTKSDKFETDSLQDQEGIMERSADSLEQDKKSTGADKLETDSLHEHDVMQTSADSLESMELSQKYESVMESSMYSVASSSFSRSSQETMRSAGSHSDSSQDIMQVSTDSWEDKDFIMDNYHQQLDVENMTYDPSVCNVMGGPNFLDYQGNVWRGMTQGNIDNYQWGSRILDYEEEEKTTSASPYLSKGPYEEKKKIFTMTEWEAMKEEKRRASLAKSSEETVEKMEESMEPKRMEDSMESRKMEDSMESKKSEDSVDSKKSEDSLESKKMEDSLEMKDESIVMQSDKSDDSTSAVSSSTTYSKSETVTCSSTSHSVPTTSTSSHSHSSSKVVTKFGTSQEQPVTKGVRFMETKAEPSPRKAAFDARRIASIDDDDFAEYDVTEHFELSQGIPERLAQQKGPRYIEPGEGHGYPDSEDEEEGHLFYEETGEPEGAEGGDLQSTKLMMKKQVHTKTVIKDGQEQTFVHEEAIVKQDSEPPEELRDSMQQIIDQFMEAPPDKEPQQMLEHDV